MKRLVAYDLDGTLAESKQPIDPETAALLARLTNVTVVAVISGGDWPQFAQQLVGKLPEEALSLSEPLGASLC
jgi:phosphomannomutase